MEITKKDLLDKTHYGLKIYAFILKEFYPNETVVSLSGRKCKPAKNPFTNHSVTLMLEEVDQVFLFQDSQDESFKGDPFDFAAKYFNVSGDELLNLLNKEMHLNIGVNPWHKENDLKIEVVTEEPRPKLILPKFSYFKAPVTNTVPEKEVSIIDVYHLIKYEFKEQTETLRNISEKKEARAYKAANFDYVTFSGVFTKRSDAELVKHSGYLAIDFDHVSDLPGLSDNLLNDEYFDTEILFTSPSGDGLKWIIAIDITENSHRDWFMAIKRYIKETYQLEVDNAGKDVSRACFLPHYSNIYLHPKYHN
ncbi:BT4734/BF3469 family protein [Fulvivirga sp.]|uniref:BT4734/BF3469 family protein n=1 Tax=Fulvivirga sp. TaxID=1931237 RepID=UPI0032F087B1